MSTPSPSERHKNERDEAEKLKHHVDDAQTTVDMDLTDFGINDLLSATSLLSAYL